MVDEKLFAEIELAIKLGNSKLAKELISKVKKLKTLHPFQRIQLAEAYKRLGEPEKGLKLLGKPLTKSELKVIAPEELCAQVTLANLIRYLGGKYIAQRIFKNIEETIKERNINLKIIMPQFYSYLANLYLSAYDFHRAFSAFMTALEVFPKGTYQYKMLKIGLADSLDGMGKSSDAIFVATEVLLNTHENEQALKAICLQARGEYNFIAGNYKKARADLDESKKYFLQNSNTHDLAHLLKWSGALFIKENNFEAAKSDLEKALALLDHEGTQPISLIAVLYWLEQILSYNLDLNLKIPLRAHHCFSPMSFWVGKRFNPQNPIPMDPWTKSQYKETKNNIWVIDENSIYSAQYQYFIKKVATEYSGSTVVDLYSGVVKYKNGKSDILSLIQSRCLAACIGTGKLGINEWSLADFIYRQEFINPITGNTRLKTLIKTLKDKSFLITRSKNYYNYKRSKQTIYILSMELDCLGPQVVIKAHGKIFKRTDVENLLGAQKRTANRLIKKWLDEKIIKMDDQKLNTYTFL